MIHNKYCKIKIQTQFYEIVYHPKQLNIKKIKKNIVYNKNVWP